MWFLDLATNIQFPEGAYAKALWSLLSTVFQLDAEGPRVKSMVVPIHTIPKGKYSTEAIKEKIAEDNGSSKTKIRLN